MTYISRPHAFSHAYHLLSVEHTPTGNTRASIERVDDGARFTLIMLTNVWHRLQWEYDADGNRLISDDWLAVFGMPVVSDSPSEGGAA